MSRSLGVNKQRTPVVQEPPRGPIMSIASAKNMGTTAQQQQQQMLKQQYMQQQQQQKLKQQKQQMANQSPQQTTNGMPSHVTVPQAISVIVSRLNSIERKISKPADPLGEDQQQPQLSEQQQHESIDLDLTIDQILERLQLLEGTQSDSLVVSKSDFDQLNNKVSKLDSDLRDSKDMVLKMQSLIITTTEQVTKLSMQFSKISLPETD